jgi:hypothetical protein
MYQNAFSEGRKLKKSGWVMYYFSLGVLMKLNRRFAEMVCLGPYLRKYGTGHHWLMEKAQDLNSSHHQIYGFDLMIHKPYQIGSDLARMSLASLQ